MRGIKFSDNGKKDLNSRMKNVTVEVDAEVKISMLYRVTDEETITP